MKNILTAVVLILSSLLAPQASAATPVEAMLTLPHDNVLPGVPFDLVVTYTNTSDKPVTIGGARATLVVTFPGGESTVLRTAEGHDHWDLLPPVPLRLAPGESAQQAVSWETGSIPNWFRHHSFSGPGTYGIALDLRIADASHNPLASVRTPEVTLTRVEPVGIDAELWKRMQEISNGQWSDNSFVAKKPGMALANEIIQLHPTSGYYPYVLALRALKTPSKDNIPVLLEVADRFPESPAHSYVLKAAADSARYEAWKAEYERDGIEAKKYFDLAQSIYRDALATKSIAIRGSAEKGLRDVTAGLERAAGMRAR
jgi:hypothetical protein